MTRRKKTTLELEKERQLNRSDLFDKRLPVSLILENVRSLDNVGLIFRLCELARVEKLYLCGITGRPKGGPRDRRPQWEIDRNDQRIKKTSIYAVPYQPWEYHRRGLDLVKKLKKRGVKIICLEQTHGSIDYRRFKYQTPLAIVLGHERLGVSQKIIDEADAVVEIPILGLGNSHNVALAGGILLYHILDKTHAL